MNGGKLSPSSKKITGRGWLLYPTESPNDDHYFNARNKLNLFDKDNETPRHKQVESALKKKTREWHNQIPLSERVHAGGKTISQVNDFNEEIPIYYTYDYVLGHYDSHNSRTSIDGNALNDTWGISGETTEGITDYVTKLSWCRFDKLIWDSLDEILTGNIRHTNGRYTDLGKDEKDDITKNLGFESGEYLKNAPILGTEVPRGIIMYHAMPFHRYWFHRTRQALRAFIERRKYDEGFSFEDFEQSDFESFDDYVVLKNKLNPNSWEEENKIADEIDRLQSYYENGLISPCPMGTVSSVQSLAKNFVLCNGQTVKFQNFPNISLTNDAIFNTIQKD